MKFREQWERALQQRFADRVSLSTNEIAAWFQPPLDVSAVDELRALIMSEFGIDLGTMRPEDSIDKLVLHPDSGGNPLRWMQFEGWSRDAANEVDEQLKNRLKRRGIGRPWPNYKTVGEVLKAWAGHTE